MHDELSDQVELASDLEWLLQSDQAKIDDLVEHLVSEYGAELNLLVHAVLADAHSEGIALVETLVQIVLHRHRFQAGQAVKVWIYSQALDAAWRVRRKWNWSISASNPNDQGSRLPFEQASGFPAWLEYFPEQSRLVVVLHRYIGLERDVIAQVLENPDPGIQQTLAIVDRLFPLESQAHIPSLNDTLQKKLVKDTLRILTEGRPETKLRRNILEISWIIGAVLLIAVITRIYDLINPDPTRQAIEIPFLTPLPTSTRVTIPTATTSPLLTEESTSDEIAIRLRVRQRLLQFNSILEDALVILGGAQGGPTGYLINRVEYAWDFQSGRMMVLVGPPDGPPTNGYYADESNHYELTIRDGRLSEVSALDFTQTKDWYYLASLLTDLQTNSFEENWLYRPVGKDSIAGREALQVAVVNKEGILEFMTWLDTVTAIPLRQQRYGEHGQISSLVLDMSVNQILLNEPFPKDYFSLDLSRPMDFQASLTRWWTDPQIDSSLRWMEQNLINRRTTKSQSGNQALLFYRVKQIDNQEGTKYSAEVFVGGELSGEYPMGNPWSVQCERSPDGKRVAYIEERRYKNVPIFPVQIFHWFSLDNPGDIRTPLPEDDATRFTFSPDSNLLAVHAGNGVSLIDLDRGQATFLLEVRTVDRLVFSEDGQYLGILRNSVLGATTIWIIYLPNRMVVDILNLEPDQDWVTQRADIFATRHVDFTRPVYSGLENCR